MRIGINGAFWGQETTGSGQYLHHLWRTLPSVASQDEYILCAPSWARAASDNNAAYGVCRVLSTPFDRINENMAKVWFEQVAYSRACAKWSVDVAHAPYFASPLWPSAPTVVTIHDLIPLLLPDYRGSKMVQGYMRLVSAAARRATLVLTDSQASARDIERILRIPAERVRVIYLAAEERYAPLPPNQYQSTLDRLGVRAPYFLYLGGFDCRKNVTGLLRAYAQARPRLGDIRLVIAGKLPSSDTTFAPDPRPLSHSLGLDDSVHYTGWVAEEDKPALYAGALAFVFPSYYEGFGLPVLEAISCGAPAIVGQGSSLEEVAGPGGLAVPPTDVGALTEALVYLAQDGAARRELAAAGLRHARQFSWIETARQTHDAYRESFDLTGRRR